MRRIISGVLALALMCGGLVLIISFLSNPVGDDGPRRIAWAAWAAGLFMAGMGGTWLVAEIRGK
jgi:hypothetical protein